MTIIFSENFTSVTTGWSLASTVERRSGDSSVTGYETTGTGGFRDTDGFMLVLEGMMRRQDIQGMLRRRHLCNHRSWNSHSI